MRFKRFYITEQKAKDFVVIYSGRFQPFHKGHKETYDNLVKKFGKDKVYIGTSNKVELPKSPFNFNEKKKIINKMFGIPSNRIGQVKNPFNPKEILLKLPETTAYIAVVGKKDSERLKGKYFIPFKNTNNLKGYEDHGYVFVAPENTTKHNGKLVSGTMVRDTFGNAKQEDKEKLFKSLYPKFDKAVFNLIVSKIVKANESVYDLQLELLMEGGAFGHLSHFHDISTNTFKDMKNFVTTALKGKLDHAKLKTDGINLMVSWIDGQLRAARNKGHLKNFGEQSLTTAGITTKFKGRGGILTAYTEAMNDLSLAISKLSDKQRDKIFANGKKWLSLEVLHPQAENIISYGISELRLQNTFTYDKDGNVIDSNQKDGKLLSGMIKQIRQDKQKTFTIKDLTTARLPAIQDFTKQRKEFFTMIDVVQKKYKLRPNDPIGKAFTKHFEELITKKFPDIQKDILNALLKRWTENNKSFDIRFFKSNVSDKKLLNWIIKFDKSDAQKEWKKVALNFELITLKLGARILKNLTDFMSVNPDKTVRKLKDKLEKTVELVKKSKDAKLIDKLNFELERLKQIGGIEAIVPEEGITFIYNGNFMKLTGSFAPLNQILGLRFFL